MAEIPARQLTEIGDGAPRPARRVPAHPAGHGRDCVSPLMPPVNAAEMSPTRIGILRAHVAESSMTDTSVHLSVTTAEHLLEIAEAYPELVRRIRVALTALTHVTTRSEAQAVMAVLMGEDA